MLKVTGGKKCFSAQGGDDPTWCALDLGNKPNEDEITRVIASYHTHPAIALDIEKIIQTDAILDPTNNNLEFKGYEFTNIEFDRTELATLYEPNDADLTAAVQDGVPGIVVAGDGSERNRKWANVHG